MKNKSMQPTNIDYDKEIAKAFAIEKGYDDVEFVRVWNNLSVFRAYNYDWDEVEMVFVGYPCVIIVENTSAKQATEEEFSVIYREL